MLYFAYGSNLDWNQMKSRCPSARFVGIAVLPDHQFESSRWSRERKCAVAGVISVAGEIVWGAVFEIDECDVGHLDAAEGYQPGRRKENNSYYREERHVFLNNDEDQPLLVTVYYPVPQQEDPGLPDQKYKCQILTGAKHWLLPNDYIRKLELILSKPRDEQRLLNETPEELERISRHRAHD